jgi:hypothetical protein
MYIEIFTFVIIHLVIPAIGLIAYLKLVRRMKTEQIPSPPNNEFFIIFSTYGGLLLIVLTSFFGAWSGMASLGMAYLIGVAPIVCIILAIRNRKSKQSSKYRTLVFKLSLVYFIVTPLTLGTVLLIEGAFE